MPSHHITSHHPMALSHPLAPLPPLPAFLLFLLPACLPVCLLSSHLVSFLFFLFSPLLFACPSTKPHRTATADRQSTSSTAKAKKGGGKGGAAGKKTSASSSSSASGQPAPGAGAPANASPPEADATPPATEAFAAVPGAEPTLADIQRARFDEEERRRTDPMTDLHLWTFRRKNPLGDGGTLPVDDPEWPGPLKEVK